MTDTITSATNPLVKELAGLKQRRNRDRSGTFLIEGKRELGHALASGRVALQRVVIATDLAGEDGERFAAAAADGGMPLTRMNAIAFGKLSLRQNPDGIAGVAATPEWTLERLDPGTRPRLLIVEGIEKPGNLGAMLRTADAVGVDAVIVAEPGVDLGNPNVIRASQGSLFDLAIAVDTTSAVIEWLQANDTRLVAATADAERNLWDADLTGAVALAVGSEHLGVGAVIRDAATTLVRIPMSGSADSLNASVAAAVLMFEALRQSR
jgi:TrmH family RNA methyltransferase